MSFRTDLRDAAALVHYELSTELGVTLTYTAKGGSPVTIYGIPTGVDGTTVDLFNLQNSESRVTFNIAKQTSFPPTYGIQEGDSMTWAQDESTSVTYCVLNGYNPDGIGAVYDVVAVNLHVQKAGG